jgi:hypothetical protein
MGRPVRGDRAGFVRLVARHARRQDTFGWWHSAVAIKNMLSTCQKGRPSHLGWSESMR